MFRELYIRINNTIVTNNLKSFDQEMSRRYQESLRLIRNQTITPEQVAEEKTKILQCNFLPRVRFNN